MSTETSLLITIPLFLVKKCTGIMIKGIAYGMESLGEVCLEKIDQIFDKVEERQLIRREKERQKALELEELNKEITAKEIDDLREDVKEGIKSLQKGMGLCSQIKVESYYKDEFEKLLNDIIELSNRNMINANKEYLENSLQEINNLKEKIKLIIQRTSKKIEQETFTVLVMEFLSQEGFNVDFNSINEETFSIIAESEQRTLKFIIDQDMNVLADFSEGYMNFYKGKCEEDCLEFINSLKRLGCKVEVKDYERKQPTKKDGAAEELYIFNSKEV